MSDKPSILDEIEKDLFSPVLSLCINWFRWLGWFAVTAAIRVAAIQTEDLGFKIVYWVTTVILSLTFTMVVVRSYLHSDYSLSRSSWTKAVKFVGSSILFLIFLSSILASVFVITHMVNAFSSLELVERVMSTSSDRNNEAIINSIRSEKEEADSFFRLQVPPSILSAPVDSSP